MVSQTERAMGTVGFADPAVVDPTTSKPYTPEASRRQTEEIFRQGKTKEEVNKLQLPKNIKKEVSEKLDLKVPTEEGILRPRARPEGLPTVYETLTPVDKVLELGYLLKEKQSGARGKTKIATGLDENNPEHQKIIKGFMDNAVGGDTGYDPTEIAWCAAFINHILTEMGADLIESEDDYKRLRADEYKNYGKPVKLEDIQEGDIVIFDWPDKNGKKDGKGDHVTFYAGGRIADEGYGQHINVLGGNQGGGEVSVKENAYGYTLDNVIAIRRITYDGDAYKIAESHKNSDPIFKTFIPKENKSYFNAETTEAPSTFAGRNRGGLEVGYEKGGLATQTEGAFNTDAEGRRRRRPSQAYLERSKEGTGQVVENVLGALPGIGTAMTVEEIQEELQKDDPNYGKIALLGGSELIGLIPGLGTAAKAGLRKVADQVGANKLVEILDSSPTVKPEREMYMGVKSKKAPGKQNILEAFERDEQDIRDRLGQTMKEELSQGKSPWILDPRNTLEDAEFAVRETNLDKHLYPRTRKAFEQEGYFLGRDKKLRFEISDKQANVQPYNIASFTEDEINNLPFTDSFAPQTWTQLDDVMDHPVLFENYPDLRDLPVIVDTDLAGKSTMGYFNHSDGGYIAISPDILKDSEQFRSTLLHEIMHSIQRKEGFEGGTTPSSLKVSKALDYERNLPEAKAAWKKYNADYADYKKAVDESLLELPDKMVSFIAEKIEKDTAGAISFQDIMNEISKGDQANFFGTFFSKAFEKMDTDLLFNLDSINTLYYYKGGTKATRIGKKQKLDSDLDSYVGSINTIYRRLLPFVKSAEDVDLFQKTMGFAPEKANDTGIAKLMRPDLEEPKTPSYVNPDSDGYLALLDRHKIYKRKMGEVEARNVQARSDLTQEEIDALRIRGKGFEESEDTPPEMQWKDSDFNKGGTVMNRQMEMAFMREGGLRDDGMNVDPVSGNEVPPGSMAKEVRDDIPARLSEGEYVVPADVVQYYGVKFFEDLRADAKIGLQEMERNGRIGGEPVDDDDLSEAEMMEIQTMMQGGMVQPQQQMDPYFQQNLMYQQPIGMANGGYSAPVIPNIGSGFSWETSGPGSITPTVPVETPETCAAKGMVYNPETKMCEPAPVTTPVVTDTGRDDRPEAPTPEPWYESITSSAEDSVNRYFGTGAKIGAGIAGFVGAASPLGILGGAGLKYGVQGTNIAQARAEVALRTAAGDVEGAEMLQKAIDKAIKGTVGLEKADQFFENTFNASGERNVISALEAIGITVPDSIKSKDFRKDPNFDSDLMDFIQSQGSKIRTDIFKMETKPTPTPSNNGNQGTLSSVASTHKERYGLGSSRRKDDSPSAAERHKKAVEATKRIEASTPKVKTKTGSGSMADVSDRAGGAAKSYSDIAKKDDPYGLLNKGGLMKKKKK